MAGNQGQEAISSWPGDSVLSFENLEDFEWASEDEPLKEDIFEDPAIKLIPLEPIDLPPLDNPAPKTPPDPTDSTPPISPPSN